MRKLLNIILVLVVISLCSLFATKSLLYSQNSFFNSPHWYTHKQFFVSANHDSIQSLFSRSLLTRNTFSGTKNFGHQLIFSKARFLPKEISFKFKLGPKGYLDVIYNYDGDTFDAARLSRTEYLTSASYKAKKSGEFIKREPFFFFIEDNAYHVVKLVEVEGAIKIFVDEKEIFKTSNQFSENQIGFFTSLQDLDVSEVNIVDKNSNIHQLNFDNELDFKKFYFKNFIILFALIASAVTAYSLLFKSEWSTSALKFSSAIFASFLLWFIFDFFYYSKLPKEFDVLSFSFKEPAHSQFTDFEEMRFSLFKKWHQLLGGKEADLSELQSNGLFRPIPLGIRFCQNSHCDFFNLEESIPVKPTGVKRVFLVGSSFSANYGVTNFDDCFFDQMSKTISSKFKNKKFEFYNFSEPGSKVHSVAERLKQNIINFDADIIIFLFLMDHQDPQAIAHMAEFIKSRNKQIFVVNPSNDAEDAYSYFPLINLNMRKHLPLSERNRLFEGEASIIDDMRFRGDIFFMNSNDVVRRPDFYNKGNIWWDSIHMTPFGQGLLAREVGQFIALNIK
jgi:hypothetical protein